MWQTFLTEPQVIVHACFHVCLHVFANVHMHARISACDPWLVGLIFSLPQTQPLLITLVIYGILACLEQINNYFVDMFKFIEVACSRLMWRYVHVLLVLG